MKRFTKEEDQFLIDNYHLLGLIESANSLNRCVGSIQYRRKFLNIQKLTKEEFSKVMTGKIKHKTRQLPKKVPVEQFINVTSPEVAYILGLIWADGYVKPGEKVVVTGVKEDLESSICVFEKTGEWNIIEQERERYGVKCKPVIRINTCNILLSEYLDSKGYKSNSVNSACSILETIPDNLKKYWFRGLFNGDGHVQCSKRGGNRKDQIRIGVASCYEQDWTYLKNVCEKLQIKYSIYKRVINKPLGKVNKSSSFSVQSFEGCNKFLNFIFEGYSEDKIGMSRKYEKWKNFKR